MDGTFNEKAMNQKRSFVETMMSEISELEVYIERDSVAGERSFERNMTSAHYVDLVVFILQLQKLTCNCCSCPNKCCADERDAGKIRGKSRLAGTEKGARERTAVSSELKY